MKGNVHLSFSRLNHCYLTENCCEVLASALSLTSSRLTELDLSDNNLKDSGVKLLSVGLGDPYCKVKSLRSVLLYHLLKKQKNNTTQYNRNNCSLCLLSMLLKQLFVVLFRLHKCKLKGHCCEALTVALSTESSQLRELDLSSNDFQEAGMKALCVGLCRQQCKLETLRLEQLLFTILNHFNGL